MTFNPFEAMNTGDWSGSKAPNQPATTKRVEKEFIVKPAPHLKPAPKMTAAIADSVVKYNASQTDCGCPDRANRGGSYAGLDGRPACKHMVYCQTNNDIAI